MPRLHRWMALPNPQHEIVIKGTPWQRLSADPCVPTVEWQAAVRREVQTANDALKQYEGALHRLTELMAGGLVSVDPFPNPGE